MVIFYHKNYLGYCDGEWSGYPSSCEIALAFLWRTVFPDWQGFCSLHSLWALSSPTVPSNIHIIFPGLGLHGQPPLSLSLRRNHVIPATAHIPGATLTTLVKFCSCLWVTLKSLLLEAFLTNDVQAIWNSVENLKKERTQKNMVVLVVSLTCCACDWEPGRWWEVWGLVF